MNNEIKEILNDLRKTADNSIFVVCSSQEELDKIPKYTANFLSVNDRQAKILLDYITKLQEENDKLKANLEMYENGVYFSSENDKLQDKIDKAIEYIEEKGRLKYKPDELLNILKGDSSNE